ncbi:MAG: hypothetical protein ABL859_01065 [Methylotenera sp.]
MNNYDTALDDLLKLLDSCGHDEELFYQLANDSQGISQNEAERILTAIESAKFRATFSSGLFSHRTSFEKDPWYLAAQRRFPAKKPWWRFW